MLSNSDEGRKYHSRERAGSDDEDGKANPAPVEKLAEGERFLGVPEQRSPIQFHEWAEKVGEISPARE